MEVLVYMLVTLALFFLGLSLGAIIENRRIRLANRLDSLEKTTQEILLPLANRVEHIDSTWTDYEYKDPDETMELPKIQTRGNNGEGKETW